MSEANNLFPILLACLLVLIIIGGVYWEGRKAKK